MRTPQYFILSFAAAFFGLTLLAMLVILVVQPAIAAGGEQSVEQNSTEVYIPTQKDSLTVLVVGTQSPNDAAQTFMLVRFNPARGQIPVLTLPGLTAVTLKGNTHLLSEVYLQGGATRCAQALQETLSIPVERTIKVNMDSFVQVVNLIGTVEYSVPQNLEVTSGGLTLGISQGRQLMDGKKIGELVTYRGYKGGELTRCNIASDIAAQAINQHLPLVQSSQADTLFKGIINLLNTDISYMDYETRKKAADFMASMQDKPATGIPLTGRFNEAGNTYILDDSMQDLIAHVYRLPPDG